MRGIARVSDDFRPVVVVPTYDNPMTVRAVIERIREHHPDVLVIDDGSGPDGRAACEGIAQDGLAHVHHRVANGGKGAAVLTGFEVAQALGFTHAFQIDADGQHDITRIPVFLETGRAQPKALLLGAPIYDDSAPKNRQIARRITNFWVNLEAGRGRITDAMVGFRVYPLARALAANVKGRRMDFDVEIAVQMARDGGPVVNLPVAVRYPSKAEGAVSHFRPFGDNLRLAWLHCRMCTRGATSWCLRKLRLRR
ncbi:MAG: glycosyltransferase involved in cell wall biosynthesis [Myxococcota bacterium]|jgi:glycosyltransferase involved in cell wall biosynthesis